MSTGTLRKFGKTWHVQFYDPATGKQTSRSLKTHHKREAEALRQKFMADLEARRDLLKDKDRLGAAIVREVDRIEREVSKSQAIRANYSLMEFFKFAGDMLLKKIDTALLAQFQRLRLQRICPKCKREVNGDECPTCKGETRGRVSAATCAKDLHFIRHLLRENGLHVEKPKAVRGDRTVVRPFTLDELVRFFSHVTDNLRCLYATALSIGARPTELIPSKLAEHTALLKSEVDLGRDTVLVRTAKGHRGDARRPRMIPIPPEVSELLADQMARTPGRYVFPPSTNIARNFDATLRRAGIEKANDLGEVLRMHSFRHTYGTAHAQNGLPAFILKEAMGHSRVSMTERYVDASQTAAPVLRLPLVLNPHTVKSQCENEKARERNAPQVLSDQR